MNILNNDVDQVLNCCRWLMVNASNVFVSKGSVIIASIDATLPSTK